MTTLTPEYFVSRWSDPQSRPLIKGRLIDDETGCCCAQGDVLRCAGFADQQLRSMTQTTADREVARLLGITIAEAALLRVVNDRYGCPQDVFAARERVLGPHYSLWSAFARHIEQMTPQDWERVAAAATAAGVEACAAAGEAAWDAAGIAAGVEACAAAGNAARDAAGVEAGVKAGAATEAAAWELVGWPRLEEPFFLRMFFSDPSAWVESIDEN